VQEGRKDAEDRKKEAQRGETEEGIEEGSKGGKSSLGRG